MGPENSVGAVSWNQVREAIRARFPVEIDEADSLGIVFDMGGGRSQGVAIERKLVEDAEWIEISTGVAAEGQLDYGNALAISGRLTVGGLALRDGVVVYRHAVPLQNFDPGGFQWLFDHIVRFGDAMEQEIAPETDVF